MGYVGYFGGWTALKFMPVYTASCIFFTIPIWASFMACFWQGEEITKYDILGVICAFSGVLLINDPMKLFVKKETDLDNEI